MPLRLRAVTVHLSELDLTLANDPGAARAMPSSDKRDVGTSAAVARVGVRSLWNSQNHVFFAVANDVLASGMPITVRRFLSGISDAIALYPQSTQNRLLPGLLMTLVNSVAAIS